MKFNPASAPRMLHRCLVLFALIASTSSTSADVSVEGTPAAVRVVATQAPVADVLTALGRRFEVRYDSLVTLESTISGTFAGPLDSVVPRLLAGFNYIIATRDGALEVIVIGKAGTISASPTIAVPSQPANTNPAAQWRSSSVPPSK